MALKKWKVSENRSLPKRIRSFLTITIASWCNPGLWVELYSSLFLASPSASGARRLPTGEGCALCILGSRCDRIEYLKTLGVINPTANPKVCNS